jgi:hypothetical protein
LLISTSTGRPVSPSRDRAVSRAAPCRSRRPSRRAPARRLARAGSRDRLLAARVAAARSLRRSGGQFRGRERSHSCRAPRCPRDHDHGVSKLHRVSSPKLAEQMPTDVIEAHVRRLPPLDRAAWGRGAVPRAELERALLTGLVAGWATHPLDNVRGMRSCSSTTIPTRSSV